MPWNGPIEKIDDYRYRIPSDYKKGMNTDGIIYSNDSMIKSVLRDDAAEQVANVASIKGIVGNSMAMPDIHWGYGFPIGGVAATDADTGVISPGGVGFDINCGVRLVRTDLKEQDIKPNIRDLIDTMFQNVPSGLGSKGRVRLSGDELRQVMRDGAAWAVNNGYGRDEDLEYLEENGCMGGVDPSLVSNKAVSRGSSQLGSLGAGNHFLEIQKVDSIFDQEAAKAYGIDEEGQIMVMIHTGSRGFGHQVCSDNLKEMEVSYRREGTTYYSPKFDLRIFDRQLACVPFGSKEADRYINGMKAAANFAWANRQMIVHWVRASFEKVLKQRSDELGMEIVYDVAHNIAKNEVHEVEGKRTKVWVHRKGATRAFGPGKLEVPDKYRPIGQPVLIPGDMGTASFVLKGTDSAMKSTFGSTCHGAGRVMSRSAAVRQFRGERIKEQLGEQGIYVRAASLKVVAEESPDVYKNVDEVVEVAHGAGISTKVAKLVPLGVVKG